MKTEFVTVQNGGIGFFGMLTLVFITLKLCKIITWSWWWILAPIWIPTCVMLALILVMFIVAINITR